MTPSGWIGVLIGIVLFGSIVGHVAVNAQASGGADCWATIPQGSPKKAAKEIDEAMNGNVQKCSNSNEFCVQYLPPPGKTGNLALAIECSATCNSATVTIDAVAGYTCFMCARGGKGLANAKDQPCKTDIVGIMGNNARKCPYFKSATAKPLKFEDITHAYCLDKCQYLTSDAHNFVGCGSDCVTFKTSGSLSASCTECADETSCYKAFGLSPPATTLSPPSPGATTRPKHGNKLANSSCLIGSMAIMLFALCHYMRQF